MKLSCVVFVVLSTILSSAVSHQQQSTDVVALMAFKNSSIHADPNGFLTHWSLTSQNPCSWNGVVCSPDNRVTSLNLINAGLTGFLRIGDLMVLERLRYVYLRGNSFFGDLTHSRSSVSCKFRILDLSSNNFSTPISKGFLSSCGHLTSLNLSTNKIPGVTFAYGASLRFLDLSRNNISTSNLLDYTLSNCQNLNLLNLSDNNLQGYLNTSVSHCKHLSTLDLSYNLFSGQIPSNFIANTESFVSLRYLDLSHNNFSGNFSTLELGNCSNITVLRLSSNRLSGMEFPKNLTNCKQLEILDLSNNSLQHKIPVALGNLKSLQELSLGKNQLSGEIPHVLGRICKSLRKLDLSSNKLYGGFPSSFNSCFSLTSLKIDNNHLSGNIPSGFCSSSSSLQTIQVASNFMSGIIPRELGNCKNLTYIDLSLNSLSGSVPSEVWALPNLSDLVIWGNSFTGKIPESLCDGGRKLETLILNNNLFTGTIPASLAKCTNLIWISLSNNRLTGNIPRSMGNLNNLSILEIGNNSLTGEIPPEMGNCRSLVLLNLQQNGLTGMIPQQLASQSGLITFKLISRKQIAFMRSSGKECKDVPLVLDTENVLTDRLEKFRMDYSPCVSTRIYGIYTADTFQENGTMTFLDLSYNSLHGKIPENLGSMFNLQYLNLGHNRLAGTIPASLGGLKVVGVFDLSYNDLEGMIPSTLENLAVVQYLDFSNNKLNGVIPSAGHLATFPASSYENNSGLCNFPMPPCTSIIEPEPAPSSTNYNSPPEKKHHVEVGVIISILLGYAVGLSVFFYVLYFKKSWRLEYFKFIEDKCNSMCHKKKRKTDVVRKRRRAQVV